MFKEVLKMFVGIFLLLLMFNNVYGHSYHLGACPNIEPEPDFNIKKVSIGYYVFDNYIFAYFILAM